MPDNSECIATIEAKPNGVLPLLDEQCRLGERGTDAALCELLNSKNPACVAAIAALGQKGKTYFRPRERFTIKHFVQPVTYTAAQFVERNSDTFFGDLSRAIAASSNALVRSLISEDDVQTEEEVARHGVGKSYGTVAERFVNDLKGLLAELGESDAGFVRCIKPNATLTPATFDASMVLHQLRTCGMVQAVKMMMSMYGARLAYIDIISGWAGSVGGLSWLPDVLSTLPPRAAVEKICHAFDVSTAEYAFGETRLFFRAGQVRLARRRRVLPLRAIAARRRRAPPPRTHSVASPFEPRLVVCELARPAQPRRACPTLSPLPERAPLRTASPRPRLDTMRFTGDTACYSQHARPRLGLHS